MLSFQALPLAVPLLPLSFSLLSLYFFHALAVGVLGPYKTGLAHTGCGAERREEYLAECLGAVDLNCIMQMNEVEFSTVKRRIKNK